jgi:hypothetical protein
MPARTVAWTIGNVASGAGPFTVTLSVTVTDPYPGSAAIPLSTLPASSRPRRRRRASASLQNRAPARNSVEGCERDANRGRWTGHLHAVVCEHGDVIGVRCVDQRRDSRRPRLSRPRLAGRFRRARCRGTSARFAAGAAGGVRLHCRRRILAPRRIRRPAPHHRIIVDLVVVGFLQAADHSRRGGSAALLPQQETANVGTDAPG